MVILLIIFIINRGSDFRLSFTELGGLRALTSVPLMALTASAPPETQDFIVQSLHLTSPVVVSRTLDRPNIFFSMSRSFGLEVSGAIIMCAW